MPPGQLEEFLLGGTTVACLVAGLFFVRFWLSARDRFFLYFAASFCIEAVNRAAMAMDRAWNEASGPHFVVRLATYALIVVAIWDKNRSGGR